MAHPRPRNCIIPAHMMERLAQQSGELADCARHSLLTSTRLAERRELMRRFAVANVAGTLRRTVYDARHLQSVPGVLVLSETGDRGLPPTNAAEEAYDYLGATYKLFQEVYGRNSIDDQGQRLDAVVHFGQGFMNAYWDGERMIFGDGDGVVFERFTKCVDIVGHELTHGIVQSAADLEYHLQPGALNESFADVFGSLVKQYAFRQSAAQADWLIGAGLLGPTIQSKDHALRSLKTPGTAFDDPRLGRDPQPGHMNDYVGLPDTEAGDWGGVHINSGIPNRAFYLLATNLGGNAWEVAGRIWYGALRQLWPTAQFHECAAVTAEVAGSMYGLVERQAVVDAWGQVGITLPSVSVPAPRPPASPGPFAPDDLHEACAALKVHLQRMTADLQRVIDALP